MMENNQSSGGFKVRNDWEEAGGNFLGDGIVLGLNGWDRCLHFSNFRT